MKPTRLIELYVQNALTIKTLKVPLANQGLVLVRGPNGVGKSAMFEALRHLLLGSTARGVKGKELIRAGAKDGYFGTLSLEKGDDLFHIQESVNHKQYGTSKTLYRGEEMVSHQRAKIRTQKQITDELLAMTEQQFDSWVFISQEAAHPLVNGTGAECAAYLSESFGLDGYDEMRAKLKEAIKQTDSQLGELKAYEQMRASAELKLAGLKSDAIDAALAKAEKAFDKIQQEIENAQKKLLDYRKTLQDVLEHERLHAQLGDYAERDRQDLVEESAQLQTKVQRINEKLAAFKAAERQREIKAKAKKRVDDLNAWFDSRDMAYQEAQNVLDVNDEQLKELEEQADGLVKLTAPIDRLENLNGSAECPTCGQPLDAKHLAKELKKAKKAESDLKDVRLRIKELQADSRQRKQLITEYNQQCERRKEAIAQFIDLTVEEVDATIDVPKLTERRQRFIDLAKELDDAVSTMDRIERLPKVQNIDAGALKLSIQTIEEVIRESQVSAREINQKLSHFRGQRREIDTLAAQVQEATEQIQRLSRFKRENELRKTLSKALARLKVRRIHGIVQAIQNTLPPYISTMFGEEDVAVEVDDQNPDSIERWCSRPHPTEKGERIRIPLRAMSKGERAKLRVAFIWAVRKLMRPERTVNILVLDEADGGLDSQGLEAYGSLLEQLKDEYESIFVISHRKELSTIRFDKTWTIEKRDGVSRLTVE